MQKINFIQMLPDNIRRTYVKEIIQNGTVNDLTWNEILRYISTFKNLDLLDNEISILANTLSKHEKEELLIWLNNSDKYSNLTKTQIFGIEDILYVDKNLLASIMMEIDIEDAAKASMAVSPEVTTTISSFYNAEMFTNVKKNLGTIPMTEVLSIHKNIIEKVNEFLKSSSLDDKS